MRTDASSLVVFNPSSWTRSDVVRVRLPEGTGVVEPGVPVCSSGLDTVILVKDIPAGGYRTLKLGAQGKIETPADAKETVLESRYYRVEFDPASGAIKSLRDKELGKELVDPQAPYGLNQYVYVGGGNGTRIVANPNGPQPKLTLSTSGPATFRRLRRPGIGEVMIVETSGTMAAKIVSEVVVWDAIRRVDLVNHVTKTRTYDKEGVYFAFPFAAQKPTFRYEIPDGIVNANRDMLPGACLDWFTVQHFVEVEGRDATIAWATPDAPLVCFQDVNRGRWKTKLDFNTGHLYAYVMNNYWHTNYLAGQDGRHVFRFSITSRAKSDRTASARFGWDASNPLLGVVVPVNRNGKLPAEPTSLLSVAEPNVMVVGAKASETAGGLIVRLWEVEGKPTTVHLRLDPRIPAVKATACNLVEMPGEPLEMKNGTVTVPVRGSGLATVRIE